MRWCSKQPRPFLRSHASLALMVRALRLREQEFERQELADGKARVLLDEFLELKLKYLKNLEVSSQGVSGVVDATGPNTGPRRGLAGGGGQGIWSHVRVAQPSNPGDIGGSSARRRRVRSSGSRCRRSTRQR